MVHFPSEGVDRLVKECAVPEAKYSCSTYPWAVRSEGLADTGSMTVPVSGGVLNTAGARQPVGSAADVVGEEVAALPHAARVPVTTRRTALHRLTLLALRCSTVRFRSPPRVPTGATNWLGPRGRVAPVPGRHWTPAGGAIRARDAAPDEACFSCGPN